MWRDEKFLSLSQPAQFLWVYLLTCPEGLSVPGIVVAGPAALGECLGWSAEQVRERFAEIEAKGMARADWQRRVVWLPNAIRHRPPSNGNIVLSWATQWSEVPDCALKHEIWRVLTEACARYQLQCQVALAEPGKGSANRMPNKDKEKEQDQDQDQEGEMSDADATRPQLVDPPAVDNSVDRDPPPTAANDERSASLALVVVEPKADPVHDFARAAIGALNRATGHAYRADSEAVLKAARTLVGKRYTPADAVAVVNAKVTAWRDDPKMAEYLRPSTLFRPSNFAGYVDDLRAGNRPVRSAPNRQLPQRSSALEGVLALIESETEQFHDTH